MKAAVRIVVCNALTYDYFSSVVVSASTKCYFFTPHNHSFSLHEQSQISDVTAVIVANILEFRDIRQVFVTCNRLTVVFKKAANLDTLPEQITRIIEKAIEEMKVEE